MLLKSLINSPFDKLRRSAYSNINLLFENQLSMIFIQTPRILLRFCLSTTSLKIQLHSIFPSRNRFHTEPQTPLPFDLHLYLGNNNICISNYCSQLPEHFQFTDRTLRKFLPQWFLAVQTSMLQIYSVVYTFCRKKTFLLVLLF